MPGRNYGIREDVHGPRVDDFGGNFARKAADLVTDDITDYVYDNVSARRHAIEDSRDNYEDAFYEPLPRIIQDMNGEEVVGTISLFDELMACPLKWRRVKRGKGKGMYKLLCICLVIEHAYLFRACSSGRELIVATPALTATTDVDDDLSEGLSDMLSVCGTDFTDGDFTTVSEFDDCWDAYEEEDQEWVNLFESEDDSELSGDEVGFDVT